MGVTTEVTVVSDTCLQDRTASHGTTRILRTQKQPLAARITSTYCCQKADPTNRKSVQVCGTAVTTEITGIGSVNSVLTALLIRYWRSRTSRRCSWRSRVSWDVMAYRLVSIWPLFSLTKILGQFLLLFHSACWRPSATTVSKQKGSKKTIITRYNNDPVVDIAKYPRRFEFSYHNSATHLCVSLIEVHVYFKKCCGTHI